MRHIVIQIDCNPKTCGACDFLTKHLTGNESSDYWECDIYGPVDGWLGFVGAMKTPNRCSACLASEKGDAS